MNLINLLEKISINNQNIYGESSFLIKKSELDNDQFLIYKNSIPECDFNIDIGGNINDFLGSDSIQEIQYMFSDIFDRDSTVFLTQHDTNIVYIENDSGKVGACISGDTLHIISKDIYRFLKAINLIQELIINKYNLNSRKENGGYVEGFIKEVRANLEIQAAVEDIEYFIEFFYE